MHANTRVCMHAHTPLVCMYTHARACVHALSQKKSYFMQRHPTVGSCGRRNQAHLVRTHFKSSPFKAWSRSVYSHTCYTYCQWVLPCLFLPFRSIHLHFFQNLSQFFPVLACRIKLVTLLDAGSRGECPRHINRLQKHDLWKDDDLGNYI